MQHRILPDELPGNWTQTPCVSIWFWFETGLVLSEKLKFVDVLDTHLRHFLIVILKMSGPVKVSNIFKECEE